MYKFISVIKRIFFYDIIRSIKEAYTNFKYPRVTFNNTAENRFFIARGILINYIEPQIIRIWHTDYNILSNFYFYLFILRLMLISKLGFSGALEIIKFRRGSSKGSFFSRFINNSEYRLQSIMKFHTLLLLSYFITFYYLFFGLFFSFSFFLLSLTPAVVSTILAFVRSTLTLPLNENLIIFTPFLFESSLLYVIFFIKLFSIIIYTLKKNYEYIKFINRYIKLILLLLLCISCVFGYIFTLSNSISFVFNNTLFSVDYLCL
jgi:hypothetical protein